MQIAYTDQNRTLDPDISAWQEISGGQEMIMVGKKELNSRAYLSSFNFKGTDQQKKVGLLSGGERNRLHLAKTLMSGGNLLLLDEPTNDLDVDTLRALEDALVDFAGCAVVISHDRWFLDRIATHILAFEGNSEVVWHEGNYQSYVEDLQEAEGRRRRPAAPRRVQEARARLARRSTRIPHDRLRPLDSHRASRSRSNAGISCGRRSLILGLGIGTAVAVFTVFRAVLFQRLPVSRSRSRRRHLDVSREAVDVEFGLGEERPEGGQAAEARTLRDVAGYAHWGTSQGPLVDGDRTLTLGRVVVTGGFFDVLGARAAVGRLLRPEDDVPGAAPVLVHQLSELATLVRRRSDRSSATICTSRTRSSRTRSSASRRPASIFRTAPATGCRGRNADAFDVIAIARLVARRDAARRRRTNSRRSSSARR